MFVMISQDGLFSRRSDSPDNAIYLGRMETPQVHFVTIDPQFLRQSHHAGPLNWVVLNCWQVTLAWSSPGLFSVTLGP